MARHTLLWVLSVQPQGASTDCEVWNEDGATHVLLQQNGRPPVTNDFPNSAEAVRWALDYEQTLLAEGWRKII
jgi:hypothetical protein